MTDIDSMTCEWNFFATSQLGKLWGAELKIAELKLALSGQNLAHIRALLQAVAKMAVVDLFWDEMHKKHQNNVQNTSPHAIDIFLPPLHS